MHSIPVPRGAGIHVGLLRLHDSHGHAAIDGDRFTCHEFVRDEKGNGFRYVLGGSLAMQRDSILQIVRYLFRGEAVLQRSSDYARRHCVHTYIEIRKFSGYCANKLRNCAFHNTVRGRAFAAAQAGRRRDENDCPTALFLHERHDGTAQVKCRVNMNVECSIPILRIYLEETCWNQAPRAMDQDIDPAKRERGFLDEAAAFIRPGDIAGRAIKPPSQGCYLSLQLFGFRAAARSQHRDISASLGKR